MNIMEHTVIAVNPLNPGRGASTGVAKESLVEEYLRSTPSQQKIDEAHRSEALAKVNGLIQQHIHARTKYEDPYFNATDCRFKSPSAMASVGPLMRPTELNPAAKLVVDGMSSGDMNQGYIGDCWLLSAVSVVAGMPGALDRIFLTASLNDAGVVAARFWIGYRWVTIITDDRLPTLNIPGTGLVLGGVSGRTKEEFWPPLLEKCLAKLLGGYMPLQRDNTASRTELIWSEGEALAAMIPQSVPLRAIEFGSDAQKNGLDKEKMWADLCTAGPAGSAASNATSVSLLSAIWHWGTGLIGGSGAGAMHAPVSPSPMGGMNALPTVGNTGGRLLRMNVAGKQKGWKQVLLPSSHTDDNNMVLGHAYAVLRTAEITSRSTGGKPQRLLQLRNPWGKGEWTGAWSDTDTQRWTPDVQAQLQWNPSASGDDGTFWMAYEDFIKEMSEVAPVVVLSMAEDGGTWFRTNINMSMTLPFKGGVPPYGYEFTVAAPTPLILHVEQTQAYRGAAGSDISNWILTDVVSNLEVDLWDVSGIEPLSNVKDLAKATKLASVTPFRQHRSTALEYRGTLTPGRRYLVVLRRLDYPRETSLRVSWLTVASPLPSPPAALTLQYAQQMRITCVQCLVFFPCLAIYFLVYALVAIVVFLLRCWCDDKWRRRTFFCFR
jgi:hypothetical protein